MKKITAALLILLLFGSGDLFAYSGGDGTEGSPYLISSRADMEELAGKVMNGEKYTGKYFLLTRDLTNTADTVVSIIGYSETRCFEGIFDGNGHEIAVKIIRDISSVNTSVGVFGYIQFAVIKNLGVSGIISVSSISSHGAIYSGGICGYSRRSIISHCYNTASISSYSSYSPSPSYSGGICGYSGGDEISHCYNTGSISSYSPSTSYSGGICGMSNNKVSNCYNTGSVSSRSSPVYTASTSYSGGICGHSYAISHCYNTGDISSSSPSSSHSGGICGMSNNEVSNCFAAGERITVSSTTGKIHAGRIMGEGVGTPTACYALDDMLVNNNPINENDNSRVNGQNTMLANFKNQAWLESTLGWDFENIWLFSDGMEFPLLFLGKEQTITWNQTLSAIYGDAPITLNASASSGLSVTYTSSNEKVATVSGNILTIVGAGTATITAKQTGNNDYNPAKATQTITVKNSQTISWNQTLRADYGDMPITLNANANSGLDVTYSSSNDNVAAVSGNTLTITGVGTTILTANQAGNANYNAATAVTRTITIGKGSQIISWNQTLSVTYGDEPITLSANTNSGLDVIYSSNNNNVATVSGNTLTITGVGTTTLTANQAGNANYNVATTITKTITVNKKSQVIIWNQTLNADYNDVPITLNASADSKLTVTYTSSNNNVAKISGNTLTIVGGGTAIITANQAGNANYDVAPTVVKTIIVRKSQTIKWEQNLNATYGETSAMALVANASSSLPITYTSDNANVATTNGSMLNITGVGTATITAHQAGNEEYAATMVTKTLSVKMLQTITWNQTLEVTLGNAPIVLNASANSGLAITYASNNTNVATVNGNTLTIVGVGTVTITANQTGNDFYHSATPITKTFTVTSTNGIEDIAVNNFLIYPNPTTGVVFIKATDDSTPEISVYSLGGNRMLHEVSNQIDISKLPKGMYIFQIGCERTKVVKE